MKDILFAGFAQLSYLNWHKLELNAGESKKLREIFKDLDKFEVLKNGDYDKIYEDGKDYLREENLGNGVMAKIYDRGDARIFMQYSEDTVNPNETPKFSEFGEWEFLFGYDHNKIREELGENSCILKEKDSGFQASAFKKGNNIIIAYRGSDDMEDKQHMESDWIETNLRLGFNRMPDALICTAWMYDKVKEASKGAEIHITGHSMGGALAQFATIYSEGKHKMVTWSALGIGEPSKRYQITNVSQNNEWLNYDFFESILEDFGLKKNGKWQSECENVSEIKINTMLKEAVNRKKKIVDTRIENPDMYELSEDEKNRLIKEIKHKQRVIYLYQKNYERLSRSNDSQKYINYYYGEDLTPNLQEKEGPVKTVNNTADKNEHDTGGSGIVRKVVAIITSNVSEYHGLPMYFPFMNDEGDITPGKLNKNYIMNGIKTIIRSDYQYEVEARQMMNSNSSPNGFPKKLDKSLEAYNRVTGNNIPNPPKELSEDMSIVNRFSFGKNLIKAVKEYKNEWYTNDEENKSVICGVFNNCEEIGGVSGGIPLVLKKVKNFKDVLNIILPPIKSKIYTICDKKALEKHKISYGNGRELNNGSVEIRTGEKEYQNDYELYPENKFGAKSEEEDGEFGMHLGVDLSYGRENEFTCSHPSVYSPINGVIESIYLNKVVIRQEKTEKVINGKKVEVYYYHEIEHLHRIDSKIEAGKYVGIGTVLGEMGGVGDDGNLYRYYQHVHYSIRMEDSYYTGYIDYNQPYSKDNIVKKNTTKQRYLNPEKFWNDRIEEGRIDFKL